MNLQSSIFNFQSSIFNLFDLLYLLPSLFDLQSSIEPSIPLPYSHSSRLNKLLDASKAKVVYGNKTEESDLYISPTILNNVTAADKLMEDEIFGPIVPMMVVENADDAIDFILDRYVPRFPIFFRYYFSHILNEFLDFNFE